MPTDSDVVTLLDPGCAAQLRGAAAVNGAVRVCGPRHTDIAAMVAATLTGEFTDHEVRACYPAGVRWKVDELTDQVLDPARFSTPTHRHLVVADAHRAAVTAHDKLLKTLEEPFSATTFWLCVPDGDQLPATLEGRALAQVGLRPPPPDLMVAELVKLGADADQAALTLQYAAGDLALAAAVTRFGLHDTLATFCTAPWTSTPNITAGRTLLAAAHLAVAMGHKTKRQPAVPRGKGNLEVPDLSKLNPAARGQTRRLVERLLDDWEAQALTRAGQVRSAAEMSTAEHSLDGLQRARHGLVFNTPLATVVATALTALNPSPDDGAR